MVLLLSFGIVLLTSMLLATGFLGWLLWRLYVLRISLSYYADRLVMKFELGSQSGKLFFVSVHNEGRQWHARVETRGRPRWQPSWTMPSGMKWLRIWRWVRLRWKHPQRAAWLQASRQLLKEVAEQLILREVALDVRLRLPTYAQTGYLAAAAYPMNFTLLRTVGVYRPRIIPDFSRQGFAAESQVRCTFRGYQMLKPGYRFLRNSVVREFFATRFSKRLRRAIPHRFHPSEGGKRGKAPL